MHEGVCEHGPPSFPVVVIPGEDQVLVDKVAVPEILLLSHSIISVQVVGESGATDANCSVCRDIWPPWGGGSGRLQARKASTGEEASRHVADGVTAMETLAATP